MLRAEKTSPWRSAYAFTVDGTPVTTFSSHWWRSGGRMTVDGREYRIGTRAFRSTYTLTDETGGAAGPGAVVATAERVARKRWTVTADGRSYEFRRASIWRSEQLLVEGGRTLGSVRRLSWWRGGAEAELPGLSLPVQLFVVAVVLSLWEQQSAAAGSGGS
ncbi:hypothetical protein GCM10009613_45870 [Pseudonocardia kongjuensis]|uniref:Uncharacterized protein n=1 Tax=Pseudonocardia kongjuensis TaxID=102227 RepID=A0ABN1Y1Y4_9PSEU